MLFLDERENKARSDGDFPVALLLSFLLGRARRQGRAL
jgi:hypothetical protein